MRLDKYLLKASQIYKRLKFACCAFGVYKSDLRLRDTYLKLLTCLQVVFFCQLSMAQSLEIYEYKNANGVTVFTNNPDKVKEGAKIAPMATMQIYSGPAINKGNYQRPVDSFNNKENMTLNNDGRRKILEQEYEREIKLLKEEEQKLTIIKKNKVNDKQQIKEISDNIVQHKDNIEILKSQIRK